MTKKEEILAILHQQGMLPLFYHTSPQTCIQALTALYKGGARLLEFTNRGANALQNFTVLRAHVDKEMKDMRLGVGTIKSADEARLFIDAGADFVVSPIVNPEVAAIVHKQDMLWIPGCFTNTEIYTAEVAGASLVKIFPGNIGGPSYISALKEIFYNLEFMPTGGVEPTRENIHAWFKAGVYAVGMGSKLVTKDILEHELFEQLAETTHEALTIIAENRKSTL